MLRVSVVVLSLALAGFAFAHSDSKWMRGPQGGHIVDAGGGKQHWELVAKGNELTLYVSDADEKPVNVDGSSATGQVLIKGKTHNVAFKPAGGNTLKATGDSRFAETRPMLPFAADQFLSVFAAYNIAIWPAQLVAYLLAAIALWTVLSARPWAGRAVAAILGTLWIWNGLAYHLTFFAPINPAAYGFAALFLLQGLLFLGYGVVAGRLSFSRPMDWRGILGLVLIAYAALVYTALGYALGHGWPNAPIFGVAPCPTTIFTFGVLILASGPLPLWLITIPVIWAGIGATAAILLSVPEDLGLLVAGVTGAILLPSWAYGRAHRPAGA